MFEDGMSQPTGGPTGKKQNLHSCPGQLHLTKSAGPTVYLKRVSFLPSLGPRYLAFQLSEIRLISLYFLGILFLEYATSPGGGAPRVSLSPELMNNNGGFEPLEGGHTELPATNDGNGSGTHFSPTLKSRQALAILSHLVPRAEEDTSQEH